MNKTLCKDCKYCKTVKASIDTTRSWCILTGNGNKNEAVGIILWADKPHLKCPLKNINKMPELKRENADYNDE